MPKIFLVSTDSIFSQVNISWLWRNLYNCDGKKLAVSYSYVADIIIKKNLRRDVSCRTCRGFPECAKQIQMWKIQISYLQVCSFGVIWIRVSDPRSLTTLWCIKQTNEKPRLIHTCKFLWCITIRVILDPWSWSRSPQGMHPKYRCNVEFLIRNLGLQEC